MAFPFPDDCRYSGDNLYKDFNKYCGPYVSALETCPTSSVTPKERLLAANQTARCMNIVTSSAIGDTLKTELSELELVPIEKNSSCNFPDFWPIVRETCSFDLSQLEETCDSLSRYAYGNSSFLTNCQREATVQYVRCTIQKPQEEIEKCVTETAVRVNWLPQIHQYSGAKRCMSHNHIIIVQALLIFGLILWAIIKGIGLYVKDKKDRRKKARVEQAALGDMNDHRNTYNRNSYPWYPNDPHQSYDPYQYGPKYPHPYNPNYYNQGQPARQPEPTQSKDETPSFWALETRYTLAALKVLNPVLREILTAYIMTLVLNQSNYLVGGDWILTFVFYAIRPRAAPFFGALGFFKNWSREGLAELAVDLWLSFLGGGYVTTQYWRLYHDPANPAAPRDKLRFLSIGSAMSVAPAYVFCTIGLLGSGVAVCLLFHGFKQNKFMLGCFFWMFMFVSFHILLIFLLFVAIIEIIAATIIKIKYRGDDDRAQAEYDAFLDNWVRRACWGYFLTTEKKWFRWIYGLMFVCSAVGNVGNWFLMVSYLKAAGELFCPPSKREIMAMWVLLPVGIDVVFGFFQYWTSALWRR